MPIARDSIAIYAAPVRLLVHHLAFLPFTHSYDLPRLQKQHADHNPRDESREAEPEHPAYPRPLALLLALRFQPRVPIRRVRTNLRPELEARGWAPREA